MAYQFKSRTSNFNLNTATTSTIKKTTELDDITELTQKPVISKKAAAILKKKHTALYKWLFEYLCKNDGAIELCYGTIAFEKLSPDLVEALMPVLTLLYEQY